MSGARETERGGVKRAAFPIGVQFAFLMAGFMALSLGGIIFLAARGAADPRAEAVHWAALGGALALPALIVSAVIGGGPGRRLRRLARDADRAASGDFRSGARRFPRDETGALAAAFERMAEELTAGEAYANRAAVNAARRGSIPQGEARPVTVCAVYLRDCAALTAGMDAAGQAAFMNEFFRRALPCVQAAGGVITGLFALNGAAFTAAWGALEGDAAPARDTLAAVSAALALRDAVREWNAERSGGEDAAPLRMACAVHRGRGIAGALGGGGRKEFAVLGEAADTAARLAAASEAFDTDILVSEAVAMLLADKITAEQVPGAGAGAAAPPFYTLTSGAAGGRSGEAQGDYGRGHGGR